MQPSTEVLKQNQKITKMIEMYTSKSFLTKHSLFNNLFSSQTFSLSAPQLPQINTQKNHKMTPQQNLAIFLKLYFNKLTIQQNQLYQFTYFHKRDKKMFLFFYILYFLENCPKTQMIIFENGDRINSLQLREFLSRQCGEGIDIIKQLQNRIKFFRSESNQVYKANLLFLSYYMQKCQYLKAVILADINQFQSGDKSSLERIYKKIPKNLLTVAMKKQIYDYKFIQNSQIPYLMPEQQQIHHYELHEKVIKNINKTIDGYKISFHSYIVPVQHIGINNKTLDQSYRSVIIRKDAFDGGSLSQYIFAGYPVQIKAYRKING